MKKALLLTAITFITLTTFAQTGNKPADKKATDPKTSPVTASKPIPAQDTIHIVFSKDVAKEILKRLQTVQYALSTSKTVSISDGGEVVEMVNFWVGAIYRKWNDLIPVQPKK